MLICRDQTPQLPWEWTQSLFLQTFCELDLVSSRIQHSWHCLSQTVKIQRKRKFKNRTKVLSLTSEFTPFEERDVFPVIVESTVVNLKSIEKTKQNNEIFFIFYTFVNTQKWIQLSNRIKSSFEFKCTAVCFYFSCFYVAYELLCIIIRNCEWSIFYSNYNIRNLR